MSDCKPRQRNDKSDFERREAALYDSTDDSSQSDYPDDDDDAVNAEDTANDGEDDAAKAERRAKRRAERKQVCVLLFVFVFLSLCVYVYSCMSVCRKSSRYCAFQIHYLIYLSQINYSVHDPGASATSSRTQGAAAREEGAPAATGRDACGAARHASAQGAGGVTHRASEDARPTGGDKR